MVVSIVGCCCQGPGYMSKKGNLLVSNEKWWKMTRIYRDGAFRVYIRVLCIYPKKEISPDLTTK